MIKLKQFVPESVCLACDGCCRYPKKETIWAPLFLYDEIVELTQANIVPSCLFAHPDIHGKRAARIDLIEHKDLFICPCFEPQENKCKIYPHRPFECQLYPFLVARKGEQAFLAVDEKCPYVRESMETKAAQDYVQYLTGFLGSEDFIRLAKNNPETVQAYGQDIKFLASLLELYGASSPQPQ